MNKKPLIPFSWTPASWGLKGKSREVAQAEYNFTGAELDIELSRIERDHSKDNGLSSDFLELQHQKRVLDIQREHKLIAEHAYQEEHRKLERWNAELEAGLMEPDSEERLLAELEIRYRYDDMADKDYNREKATIQGEPWVDVVQVGFEDSDATKGYFELDWNDEFVKWLSTQGIVGRDDEDTVNKWFNSVCRTVLIQEMQDQDWGMQTDQTEGRPDVEYRKGKSGKTSQDDGGDTTDH